MKEQIKQNRNAIKPSWEAYRKIKTPHALKEERPAQFKVPKEGSIIIDLPKEFPSITQKTLQECIKSRRSTRAYSDQPLSFEEVAYILYETARVDSYKTGAVFRSIPTGGATNAMETYLYANHVDGLDKGLYLYVQDKHQLALIRQDEHLEKEVNNGLFRQLRGASIVLLMTTIPYRSEYKYAFCAHKMIAMEAGHTGQNASLAAEVVDAGACCLAAYNQTLLDQVLEVDGVEEFSTYAITIGKK